MKEAQEKISLLNLENVKLREVNAKLRNEKADQTDTDSKKKTPRELRQLQLQNNVLQARLKQAECGIRQKESYERKDENSLEQKEEFEVERIMNHKVSRGQNLFFIRWKGFGPDFDTWERECSLTNCSKMLDNYKRHNKV